MKIEETAFFQEFLALKEEVLKHKWYESEKAGHDIGFTQALINWTMFHKLDWQKQRKKTSLL